MWFQNKKNLERNNNLQFKDITKMFKLKEKPNDASTFTKRN